MLDDVSKRKQFHRFLFHLDNNESTADVNRNHNKCIEHSFVRRRHRSPTYSQATFIFFMETNKRLHQMRMKHYF